MSGIPLKNHGKKTQGFLRLAETNLCEITQKQMKNIPYKLEAEQPWTAGCKDEKKNWKLLVNTA